MFGPISHLRFSPNRLSRPLSNRLLPSKLPALPLSTPCIFQISSRKMHTKNPSTAQKAVINAARLDLLEATPKYTGQEKERLSVARNFCSDTVTAPSHEMLEYAIKATSLGDDVFGWDYCTNKLEEHVAKLCGKEAAIFVSSGTAGNQISLRCLLGRPPYSVLCDYRSHINQHEAGGTAFHSGATCIPAVPRDGKHLSLEDVKSAAILSDDIHYATTQVIALENTLHGTIHPQSSILEIAHWAKEKGLKLHLDGARLWHVSIETGLSLEELCRPFDTISLCFSKGLGAPAGSIIVGSSETISLARRYRKLFGGGMRQIGILSSCAAYALTHHVPLLPTVHHKAKHLASELAQLGIKITHPVETCMVWCDFDSVGLEGPEIAERAKALENPILMFDDGRIVVHIQTSDEAIQDLVGLIRTMAHEKETNRGKRTKHGKKGAYGAKL